ncbi:MAG: acylphosphatase [Trueperaceae bacterium]
MSDAPNRSDPGRTERLTALIEGRVQGVGYRAFAQRRAIDLGLAGTAENLPDGRVEVVAEGPRSELDQLLVFLRRGPSHAKVTSVETHVSEGGGLDGFYVY